MVDIDHFKRVNDRFGHLYGDEVLILVANILRSSFRSHDRIFRFGGEEFVVLLRNTTLSKAHKVFNRFREAVQEYHFPQVGNVTVSLGFVGTSRGSPVEILGQADQALFTPRNMVATRCASTKIWSPPAQLATKVANDDVELFKRFGRLGRLNASDQVPRDAKLASPPRGLQQQSRHLAALALPQIG